MERNDIIPINSSWEQTNTYLVNDIKNIITKMAEDGQTINITVNPASVDVVVNPTPVDITVNPTPVDLTVNPTPLDINITQTIYLPRETKYVSNSLPIIQPQNGGHLTVVRNYVKPEPLIVDVERQSAYLRVCGSCVSMDSRCSTCHRCVDAWLAAHQDGFELKELTSAGTGCFSNEVQRVRNCGCTAPSNITDRKGMRAYHECKQRNNIK